MIAPTLLLALVAATAPQKLAVNAEAGNNTFSAVFDAKVGERINAVSSAVGCALTYDEGTTSAAGTCSVPLKSIMVDNEPTKTEHFQQWSTNKKGTVDECRFEAKLGALKLQAPLSEKPVKFSGDATFTVCGRARTDGGKEKITGEAMLMPGGSTSVKIRAQVKGFNRDAYKIGPKYTEGWAARVQQLAPVVAETGTIDFSIFAKEAETRPASKP